MFIGGVNIIKKSIIFSLLIIFILIPTAYAADIDDSIANDNLAVDDSMDLIVDDGASIQDDSLGDNLKSAGLKESSIDQDKKSIAQDELLEDSDDYPEEDGDDSEGEEDDSDGEEDESDGEDDSEEDEIEEDDSEEEEDDSEYEEDDSDEESDDSDDEYDDSYLYYGDGEYSKYYAGAYLGSPLIKDPYVYYMYLPDLYDDLDLTITRSPKSILDPCITQTFWGVVSAKFLDKDGNPLKDTEVIFLVNGTEWRVKTDSEGYAELGLRCTGYYFFAIINPVTGECYIFPELMRVAFYPSYITGFRHDGNTYMFTVNSNGVKSTIKNEKGLVSKAITFSRDKLILSTKDNGDTEQIVVDRLTRYSIYLLAILCIVVPIGILRYRKGK